MPDDSAGPRPQPRPPLLAQSTPRAGGGTAGRLSGGAFLALAAFAGLVAVVATDQIVPASSSRQAELRIWLASRATAFVSLGLLTAQVAIGLVLSHPTNKTTWKLSRRLFPWHENAWIFVLTFLAIHVVSIIVDRYAGVGLVGAFVPGFSSYRGPAIAVGTLGLYALLVTGLSARYTKRLPAGVWLKIHRLSVVVWALAWTHGLLAGTDAVALSWFYGASFAIVVGGGAYRYWASRQGRATFSTIIQEVPT